MPRCGAEKAWQSFSFNQFTGKQMLSASAMVNVSGDGLHPEEALLAFGMVGELGKLSLEFGREANGQGRALGHGHTSFPLVSLLAPNCHQPTSPA